jgi:hypothetical protein
MMIQNGECSKKARRVKRDNECNRETNRKKKNRFEECHIAPGVRPGKGHLTPEVKMANEIVYDHVWDKLYPPISVTYSKWCIRKALFVLRAQSLDVNPLSCFQPS